MLESIAKTITPSIFKILSKPFIVLKINPTFITFCAFVIGAASGFAIGTNKFMLGLILMWLSGLLDVLDGNVARGVGKSSNVGMYVDLISDRLVECFIIIGFAIAKPEYYLQYIIFLTLVIFCFTTFLLAGMVVKNTKDKGMHYDIGIMERAEVFVFFTFMLLFPSHIYPLFIVMNSLIFLTGLLRFIKVVSLAKYV
jgi:phosphatidylglycerophosphate synthase